MLQRLPGGICFSHGPYKDTIGCPQWPACITDPQKSEYVALAESQKPKPHVCPPISAALREKIEAELTGEFAKHQHAEFLSALNWLLREADALAEREEKAK